MQLIRRSRNEHNAATDSGRRRSFDGQLLAIGHGALSRVPGQRRVSVAQISEVYYKAPRKLLTNGRFGVVIIGDTNNAVVRSNAAAIKSPNSMVFAPRQQADVERLCEALLAAIASRQLNSSTSRPAPFEGRAYLRSD
ncbi:DUF4429 domain-containing protein [Streptomyces sp. NPDC048288]|uniref:DUF4429 domain-containing protein n=1 Tax=Streptomyces sp. NPDC048288 TaxID=3365529 RepID=UPI003713D2A0